MIVRVERLLERAFLSERMGRPVSHPLDMDQSDTNVPQNMHRTLGELGSGSWGHFFSCNGGKGCLMSVLFCLIISLKQGPENLP